MTETRREFSVLGRVIGTATAWDELDYPDFVLYDFEPTEGFPLDAASSLNVLITEGDFETTDCDGETVGFADIPLTLAQLPRKLDN